MRDDVAVLFARGDSCYFDLAREVWCAARDARGYRGPLPVVAHPPCRGWGRLSHLAVGVPEAELALAHFAVACVRRFGGVLEHPHASKLWGAALLPRPGAALDAFGGFSVLVDQGWWGHAAPKASWLYCVGMPRFGHCDLPVQLRRAVGRVEGLTRADRERTPVAFARWLLSLAASASVPSVSPAPE